MKLKRKITGNDQAKVSIQRNAASLLHLVNQMLDLSRLEAGNLPIHLIQGDIVVYMGYLMESFQSFAQSKNIKLHFLPQMKSFLMDYDPDKLMKIVANLISNAIKFTEAGGHVYVMISHDQLVDYKPEWKSKISILSNSNHSIILQVRDTGIGIPDNELDSIFSRYYQVNNSAKKQGDGTGIGLAFASELAKLLGGGIEAQSEVGVGSVFTVFLPVSRNQPLTAIDVSEQLAKTFMAEDESRERLLTSRSHNDPDAPKLLIVEDNEDVKEYIATCLSSKYHLIFASDGYAGVEKAMDLTPDLVITDVMMPKKDGFELCSELKQDFRTSHIPVIILTAKADIDSRIIGLEHGADAYLIKPFNEKELLVRIEQLIAMRRRMQERYKSGITSISLHAKDRRYKLEDSFILKIQNAILDNLDDETFDTEKLCRHIGMSASQLYRKLKALTGKSTAIYIRSIRLANALELLQQTEKSISEIAYEVGFKDAAYFSRCFSEEYGQSPRSIRTMN